MTGAEDTAGAAREAAREAATEAAAVTKEGGRDVQSSGFVDSAQIATTNVRIDGQTTP